jgi:hypothetical protein
VVASVGSTGVYTGGVGGDQGTLLWHNRPVRSDAADHHQTQYFQANNPGICRLCRHGNPRFFNDWKILRSPIRLASRCIERLESQP